MKDEPENTANMGDLIHPSSFILQPCFNCPCPDICAAGVLCELAPDPARHAHIRNVSALKRGDPTTRPATGAPEIRIDWSGERGVGSGEIKTPCCGG